MKTNDLYIEYARVIEMCKGTALEVKPWKCVKKTSPTFMFYSSHPAFNENEQHEFAVAILEDKPVFIGDEAWHRQGYKSKFTLNLMKHSIVNFNDYTWQKPSPKPTLRTITLRDTGETRPPVVGEYVRTDVGFTKCLFPYVFIKDCEIWVEVKP